jgi:hypothetical protein
MNKKQILYRLFMAVSVVGIVVACSKEIVGTTDNASALQPANIDVNAGTWKPILLSGPTDIVVATPVPTNTPDYIAQINEIKSYQANISNDEKKLVAY